MTTIAVRQSVQTGRDGYDIFRLPTLAEALGHYASIIKPSLTISFMLNELIHQFKFDETQLIQAFQISEDTLKLWISETPVNFRFKYFRKVFSLYCLAKNLSNESFNTSKEEQANVNFN